MKKIIKSVPILTVLFFAFVFVEVANSAPVLYLAPGGPEINPVPFSIDTSKDELINLNLYMKFLEIDFPSSEYDGFFGLDTELSLTTPGIIDPDVNVVWGDDIDTAFSQVDKPSDVQSEHSLRIRAYTNTNTNGLYGDIEIAKITFKSLQLGSTTISLLDTHPNLDVDFTAFKSDSFDGDVIFLGGDVSCVPIPGAVFLLGSGLLGLIGIGRKRMKKA